LKDRGKRDRGLAFSLNRADRSSFLNPEMLPCRQGKERRFRRRKTGKRGKAREEDLRKIFPSETACLGNLQAEERRMQRY